MKSTKVTILFLVIALLAVTLVAYEPVRFCNFVNYDDNLYVTANSAVTRGLTRPALVWAFTTGYAANWHPLTWISHMLDVQLYGLNPEGHHLTNVTFHTANALLLFSLLLEWTGAAWPSAVVAALFAVHPLHVESVAWVAERKDVLSTFFWMLTLCAYTFYVRQRSRQRFAVVLGLFAAGLMAKPMIVTLPFLLLVLDFWPLGRWSLSERHKLPALVREKMPLLALTAVSSVITFIVQKQGLAVIGLDSVPLANRIENAFLSYLTYAWHMVWPHDLAVLYPIAVIVPGWWVLGLIFVGIVSILAVCTINTHPYFAVGWFWYIGTLIPTIGLVQVGSQTSADRYTYVPLVGLFIIVAFGARELIQRWPAVKPLLIIAGAAMIILCVGLTRSQLKYWRDSQAMWSHALAVNEENALAHVNVGSDLELHGKLEEALRHYRRAVEIYPGDRVAQSNLGSALEHHGDLEEAIFHDREALMIGPESGELDFNLGNLLLKSGKPELLNEAATRLTQAVKLNPNLPAAHNSLGLCYLNQGKWDKAITELREAIKLNPRDATAHNNLATALGETGKTNEAISEYRRAVELDSGYADAHDNLGILLASQGNTSEAIEHFAAALHNNSKDDVAVEWLAKLSSKKPVAARN